MAGLGSDVSSSSIRGLSCVGSAFSSVAEFVLAAVPVIAMISPPVTGGGSAVANSAADIISTKSAVKQAKSSVASCTRQKFEIAENVVMSIVSRSSEAARAISSPVLSSAAEGMHIAVSTAAIASAAPIVSAGVSLVSGARSTHKADRAKRKSDPRNLYLNRKEKLEILLADESKGSVHHQQRMRNQMSVLRISAELRHIAEEAGYSVATITGASPIALSAHAKLRQYLIEKQLHKRAGHQFDASNYYKQSAGAVCAALAITSAPVAPLAIAFSVVSAAFYIHAALSKGNSMLNQYKCKTMAPGVFKALLISRESDDPVLKELVLQIKSKEFAIKFIANKPGLGWAKRNIMTNDAQVDIERLMNQVEQHLVNTIVRERLGLTSRDDVLNFVSVKDVKRITTGFCKFNQCRAAMVLKQAMERKAAQPTSLCSVLPVLTTNTS